MIRILCAGLLLFTLVHLVSASDSGIIDAIDSNDPSDAISLIESGQFNVDQANRYGVRPLSLACENGYTDVIAALLKAGANPNTAQPGGETALMTAARTGLVEPLQLLLKSGADIAKADSKGQTALIWAAAEGHAEVVNILLKSGAVFEHRTTSGFTALHFASRNGRLDVVKSLISAGADVNQVIGGDKRSNRGPLPGTSALMFAVENAHYEVAVALLAAGANPDDQRTGEAPLHRLTHIRKPPRGDSISGLPPAEGSGNLTNLQFARILVEDYGAEVNGRLKNGSKGGHRFGTKGATPFLLAARKADLPYMKLLLELGADPDLMNQDETTSLLAASGVGSRAPEEEAGTERERLDAMAWLVNLGANVNHKNVNGETAMHGAAYKNIPKVVDWLVVNGCEIEVWNEENRFGRTPLDIARGFRPGNFKPSATTIEAIEKSMLEAGVAPPVSKKRN